MGLVAGVSAHTGMARHSRRGCCGGSRGIPAVVAVVATVVAWLVGLPAPAPVWARAQVRPRVPAAAEFGTAAAMLAATALAGLVLVAAEIAAAVAVGIPAGGLVSAVAASVVVVGETQGPVAQVWCYSGGQRLTRRAYWHCFRVGRS